MQSAAGSCRYFAILYRHEMHDAREGLVDAASLNPVIFMGHDAL
jgi:hypothetical protein